MGWSELQLASQNTTQDAEQVTFTKVSARANKLLPIARTVAYIHTHGHHNGITPSQPDEGVRELWTRKHSCALGVHNCHNNTTQQTIALDHGDPRCV